MFSLIVADSGFSRVNFPGNILLFETVVYPKFFLSYHSRKNVIIQDLTPLRGNQGRRPIQLDGGVISDYMSASRIDCCTTVNNVVL